MSIKKSQILKFGPRVHELVKQNVNLSTLNKQTLKFLLSCISCLINNHPFFTLKNEEKAAVKEIMLPYKKYFVTIANPNKKNNVLTAVKKQTGRGVILSSLIASAIPLISTILKKILK